MLFLLQKTTTPNQREIIMTDKTVKQEASKQVRPFYIKFKSSMRDETVWEVLEKAVHHGADSHSSPEYMDASSWLYFGVDTTNDTEFYDFAGEFNNDGSDEEATEITLSQVDHWLEFGCLDEAPSDFDKAPKTPSKQETPSPDTITSVEDKLTSEEATEALNEEYPPLSKIDNIPIEELLSFTRATGSTVSVKEGEMTITFNEEVYKPLDNESVKSIMSAIETLNKYA